MAKEIVASFEDLLDIEVPGNHIMTTEQLSDGRIAYEIVHDPHPGADSLKNLMKALRRGPRYPHSFNNLGLRRIRAAFNPLWSGEPEELTEFISDHPWWDDEFLVAVLIDLAPDESVDAPIEAAMENVTDYDLEPADIAAATKELAAAIVAKLQQQPQLIEPWAVYLRACAHCYATAGHTYDAPAVGLALKQFTHVLMTRDWEQVEQQLLQLPDWSD